MRSLNLATYREAIHGLIFSVRSCDKLCRFFFYKSQSSKNNKPLYIGHNNQPIAITDLGHKLRHFVQSPAITLKFLVNLKSKSILWELLRNTWMQYLYT